MNCRRELSKPEQSDFSIFLFEYGYRPLSEPSYLDLYNQRSELGLRNTRTRKTDLDDVACSDTGSNAFCARVWKIPCYARCAELERVEVAAGPFLERDCLENEMGRQ